MDGLEDKLQGKAKVVRLDVFSQIGRQAARRYGVRGTPTLIVVDGTGQVVLGQIGIPRPGPILKQVDALLASN